MYVITLAVVCLLALIGCSAVPPEGRGRQGDDDVVQLINAPLSKEAARRPKPNKANNGNRNKRETTLCGPPTTMTDEQKAESLEIHNFWRSKEPGADVFKQRWSEYMASLAQAWANECKWQHGMLYDCNNNRIGQNLYMIYNRHTNVYPTLNLTSAITVWNNERDYWDFSSSGCIPGQVCGHWTQMVWSTNTEVGCAVSHCPVAQTVDDEGTVLASYPNAVIVACDYFPGGNVVGKSFYTPGTPCSKCETITRDQPFNKGFKCINNLCDACDPATDSECSCGPADDCSGHGTWSDMTCTCTCDEGYLGKSCERECVNLDEWCDYWQETYNDCDESSIYYSYMQTNCVVTCGFC